MDEIKDQHDEIQRDTGEMKNITTRAYQCGEIGRGTSEDQNKFLESKGETK